MSFDDYGGPQALDRSDAAQPVRARRAAPRKQHEEPSKAALLCHACRAAISDEGQRIEVNGRHRHARVNPHGLSFVFGCFRRAPGATGVGEAIAEHTWFTGFRWRIACCGRCGEHLGWRYEGPESFYGLILARLVNA